MTFTGYTPDMLDELDSAKDKPVILICGGVQTFVKHAFVAKNEEEFGKDQIGSLVIDLDV